MEAAIIDNGGIRLDRVQMVFKVVMQAQYRAVNLPNNATRTAHSINVM